MKTKCATDVSLANTIYVSFSIVLPIWSNCRSVPKWTTCTNNISLSYLIYYNGQRGESTTKVGHTDAHPDVIIWQRQLSQVLGFLSNRLWPLHAKLYTWFYKANSNWWWVILLFQSYVIFVLHSFRRYMVYQTKTIEIWHVTSLNKHFHPFSITSW